MGNPKGESNITREGLTELMKQVSALKEKLRVKTVDAKKWDERFAAIDHANLQLSTELENRQKENRYYTYEIENKSKALKIGQQQLNWYKDRNQNEIRNYWKYCEEMLDKHRHLFIDAYIEYRSENLSNDIEKYVEKTRVIMEDIVVVDNEIEELTKIYGLIELGTNEQAKIYQDTKAAIVTLSQENGPLLLATRAAENEVMVLKHKIKQKEREIMNLVNKRQIN